ncbi:MAG: prepilin-type N-terminal cleavage/methylation domain-containing protein [Candidatus Orphnella occulta]|nr:prepilin-type N-terminal cleavage/methylation domain-containing protein [Candidatus Orphnella occulta]
MKKGFTLSEIIVVVVILGIIAAVSFPVYNKIIKRTGFKEVASIVSLVRSGAKYYDLKYDLSALVADDTTVWDLLKVDKPTNSGAKLTYAIVESGGDPELQVEYNGNQIYTYNLLTGASTEAGADSAYLPSDLP